MKKSKKSFGEQSQLFKLSWLSFLLLFQESFKKIKKTILGKRKNFVLLEKKVDTLMLIYENLEKNQPHAITEESEAEYRKLILALQKLNEDINDNV